MANIIETQTINDVPVDITKQFTIVSKSVETFQSYVIRRSWDNLWFKRDDSTMYHQNVKEFDINEDEIKELTVDGQTFKYERVRDSKTGRNNLVSEIKYRDKYTLVYKGIHYAENEIVTVKCANGQSITGRIIKVYRSGIKLDISTLGNAKDIEIKLADIID